MSASNNKAQTLNYHEHSHHNHHLHDEHHQTHNISNRKPVAAPQQGSLLGSMLAGAIGACIAETVTIPIDQAKVRMQLQTAGAARPYTGMLSTIYRIGSEESVGNLYRGLTPGLHRQFANCSVRFGAYETVRNYVAGPADANGVKDVSSLRVKVIAAAITGAIAIFFANPFDVAKVRMQAMARELGSKGGDLKISSTKVYSDILKNEGFYGFYRGIQPNIFRNICVNIGEMASYDQFKQLFLAHTKIPDAMPLHFICGFLAGFVATIIGSPADVVKTRLMSSPDSYTGVMNCFQRMIAEEGLRSFYNGFVPNFMRLSLWSITCFIAMEKIKKAFNKPKPGHE